MRCLEAVTSAAEVEGQAWPLQRHKRRRIAQSGGESHDCACYLLGDMLMMLLTLSCNVLQHVLLCCAWSSCCMHDYGWALLAWSYRSLLVVLSQGISPPLLPAYVSGTWQFRVNCGR